MSTVHDPRRLDELVARLAAVRPDAVRRWGTMTASEMLCHLADANEWAVGRRVPPGLVYPERVHWTKWVALYTPLPWPRGFRTRPGFDPKLEGTRPDEFSADRDRTIDSVRAVGAASAGELQPAHMIFGPMTRRDWGRWAWRHVDYHLRQFGL